jgi:hypothetical protein
MADYVKKQLEEFENKLTVRMSSFW